MGLVDYASDSDSGSDPGPASGSAAAQPAQRIPKQSQPSSKKPFRKVVDRSNPGKIVVSLPTPAPSADDTADRDGEGPPAKRARTAGGGGLFSGFNSFLPAPKNNGRQPAVASSASGSATRSGVNLKTSAAPGFSRDGGEDEIFPQHAAAPSTTESPDHTPRGLNLPPPKRQEAAAPSIPEGQIPAEQVKLVGKPLMFRPLSVGLNTKKKNKNNKLGSHPTAAPQRAQNSILSSSASSAPTHDASVAAPKKKVSLFSLHAPEPTDGGAAASTSPHNKLDDAYEPLFTAAHEAEPSSAAESWETAGDAQRSALMNQATMTTGPTQSLDHMADDLNLSAAARRELFGRDGSNFAAKTVVNFNMDKEYQHNEDVRASGDQQMHHPVRAIQSGKHSLKQLVQNVQNQKDALEDSFAKGRSNRKEASSRYGW